MSIDAPIDSAVVRSPFPDHTQLPESDTTPNPEVRFHAIVEPGENGWRLSAFLALPSLFDVRVSIRKSNRL